MMELDADVQRFNRVLEALQEFMVAANGAPVVAQVVLVPLAAFDLLSVRMTAIAAEVTHG